VQAPVFASIVAFASDVKEMGALEDEGPEWDDDDSETSGDEAGTSMGREEYSCSWCQ
jgi:hypothetical protein